MTDRYAVFGNPIAHSKSPRIHAAFAEQTGQTLTYEAILAPLDGFAAAVAGFRDEGGRGANVTVPFKEQAFALSNRLSERAQAAGAVNTLTFDAEGVLGDNTDGIGLVNDLAGNLGLELAGKRILLMGAGGAARGVVLPLLEKAPSELFIVNRTAAKARELVAPASLPASFNRAGKALKDTVPSGHNAGATLAAGGYADISGRFDLVINATAASLAGDLPPLPSGLFADGALAYDMMYGKDTPFLAFARSEGARCADGLGMLVEQAAAAFFLWRGVRPATAPVIALLRAG
ncbi:MAG: shikimate dehydrogenase [Pseudomonadota bacterium]|nr:shikimate dehydrogenase [Pseudomonadota bacterium]